MKSTPSFSLRIWRSLCKALSWSTLWSNESGLGLLVPAQGLRTASLPQARSRGAQRCSACSWHPRPTSSWDGPTDPQRRAPHILRLHLLCSPSPHSLEEFDVPIIQTVIHEFDCIVSWKAGKQVLLGWSGCGSLSQAERKNCERFQVHQ